MNPPERDCVLSAADPTAGLVREAVLPPAPAGLVLAAPAQAWTGNGRGEMNRRAGGKAKPGVDLVRQSLRLWSFAFLLAGGWYLSVWIRLEHTTSPFYPRAHSIFGLRHPWDLGYVQAPVSLIHLAGGLVLASLALMLFSLQREKRRADRLVL
jgi:hypothetical protein